MKNIVLFVASALAVVTAATPASAAIITTTYRLTASGFSPILSNNNPSPVQSIDTTFTLSYDNAADVVATALGSTLGLASPYGNSLNFAYLKRNDSLTIGQSVRPGGTSYTAGSIGFSILNASSSPTLSNFVLTIPSRTAQYMPNTTTISIVPAAVAAVPEPATWALMLVGFGMVAMTARYRRRGVKLTYA